jgi:hypothetical protein
MFTSFATQILQILTLCGAAFLCPVGAGWKYRPVPAPPAARRVASNLIKQTKNDYYRTLEDTCVFGSIGCITPGYLVQWPYLDDGAGKATFPEGLKSSCGLSAGGDEGYMWDYFNSTLIPEFYSCKSDETPFAGANSHFHFRKDWYTEAHRVTLDCMRELKPFRDTEDIKDFNSRLRPQMESCFLNHKRWGSLSNGGFCDCKITNVAWTMSEVSVSGSNPRMININQHNLYGCFFNSPTAAVTTKWFFDVCASFPPPPIQVGPYSDIVLEAEARIYEVRSIIRHDLAVCVVRAYLPARSLADTWSLDRVYMPRILWFLAESHKVDTARLAKHRYWFSFCSRRLDPSARWQACLR